jgi:hypothetical protein
MTSLGCPDSASQSAYGSRSNKPLSVTQCSLGTRLNHSCSGKVTQIAVATLCRKKIMAFRKDNRNVSVASFEEPYR